MLVVEGFKVTQIPSITLRSAQITGILAPLIAVSVVVIIRVVGLILVIALLTIPPYIAEKYARSLLQMIGLAGLLSGGFTLVGLYLSYRFDLTSGATIILVAAAGFFACLALERLKTRRRRPPAAENAGPSPR
jgi:zinc transport system permease protein